MKRSIMSPLSSTAVSAEKATAIALSALPSSPSPSSSSSSADGMSGCTTTTTNSASKMRAQGRLSMMGNMKIMSSPRMLTIAAVLLLCGLASVNGLKCYMCGQYNEGVGSITPCLNYSDKHAHVYLKECSKKSEKYCVKYVSELSTVRDCATDCVEKEIWETQTYCCNQDGCNGSNNLEVSSLLLMIPMAWYFLQIVIKIIKLNG